MHSMVRFYIEIYETTTQFKIYNTSRTWKVLPCAPSQSIFPHRQPLHWLLIMIYLLSLHVLEPHINEITQYVICTLWPVFPDFPYLLDPGSHCSTLCFYEFHKVHTFKHDTILLVFQQNKWILGICVMK